MVLRQILQLVVVQVAAQPRRRQDNDLPVVEPAPATLTACPVVDILAHQTQEFAAQLGVLIQVLQSTQNRHDFVAAIQIEFHLGDGKAVQTFLRTRQTHVVPP